MTIDEELSIIRDNIAEYGQTNITQEEYNMIYNKAIDDFANMLKASSREHFVDSDGYFGGILESILYQDDIDEIAEQLKAGGENV